MKHLAYRHSVNRSLVETIWFWVRGMLPRPLRDPQVQSGRGRLRSRLLVAIGWLIALVVQAALIYAVQELVQLVHGVISLYLDLARLQLDLTSQYVTATTPK